MKKLIISILFSIASIIPAAAIEYAHNTILFNLTFGIGTFSAGEYDNGSVFLGCSISTDWISNGKNGISYGIETALLGGKKQNNNILGIPVIFRIGWHPDFFKLENIDLFVLGKIGWAFGLWGSNMDEGSTSGGIMCGVNIGGSYNFTPVLRAYVEIGYNYYGLARNSNYPEYPLGYGSGKTYTSVGVSLQFAKEML